MGGTGIRLYGDWEKAERTLQGLSGRFRKAVEGAMLKEAHFLRAKLVQGVASGAPGGKTYAPLSALTLAIRKMKGFSGTKPMIRTGTFRSQIVVVREGGSGPGGKIFVGIRRGARTLDGKDLVNIAELHEFGGAWTQRLTDKSRRFLFAAIRNAGLPRRPPSGVSGYVRIKIPARPTFGPVFEAFAKPEDVKKRFWANVADAMGGQLGRP